MTQKFIKFFAWKNSLFCAFTIWILLSFTQPALAFKELPTLPDQVMSYIQSNIVNQDVDYKTKKDICVKTATGAEKLVCRLSEYPLYALEICKKNMLDIKGVGQMKCEDFITRQVKNAQILANGTVDTVKTYLPIFNNLKCAKDTMKNCSGFVQQWEPGILAEKNLYISYIEDEQKNYKNALDQDKKNFCTKDRFKSIFADSHFINLLIYVNSKSSGGTEVSLQRIWSYMFPNQYATPSKPELPPYNLILDLQGYLVNTGHFIVNDPDDILIIDGQTKEMFYQETKGHVPYCWYSFMSALLE